MKNSTYAIRNRSDNPIVRFCRMELAERKLAYRAALRRGDVFGSRGAQDAVFEAMDFIHALEESTGEDILSTTRAAHRAKVKVAMEPYNSLMRLLREEAVQ